MCYDERGLQWRVGVDHCSRAGGIGGEIMKVHRVAWQVACALGVCAAQASAQTSVPVTIQLPSFSTFSVSTTVVVPDSGRGFMGRVNQFNQGRTSAGAPFGNKLVPGLGNHGSSSETTHAGMHATATILDRMELDPYTREAALGIKSAARDENDLAGLAIDYLRARDAARSLTRYGGLNSLERRSEQGPPIAPVGRSAYSGAVSSSEATSDVRSRGLLHFPRSRTSALQSPSLVSRRRDTLRPNTRPLLESRPGGLTGRSSPATAPRLRPNYMVYPAPREQPTASDLRNRATTRGPGS
jgi:hypothetical protein